MDSRCCAENVIFPLTDNERGVCDVALHLSQHTKFDLSCRTARSSSTHMPLTKMEPARSTVSVLSPAALRQAIAKVSTEGKHWPYIRDTGVLPLGNWARVSLVEVTITLKVAKSVNCTSCGGGIA